MRKRLLLITLGLPVIVSAQQGLSEEQIQMMMQNAEKMQACMAEVDQKAMDRLASQGREVQAQIKSLCDAGDRKAAQQRGLQFAREMSNNVDVKKMRECSAMMKGIMPQSLMPTEQEMKESHVCDGI